MKTNKAVIADTSGLISLVSKDDSNYKEAISIGKSLSKVEGRIYIPTEIFAETMNVLGKKINHASAIRAARKIERSPFFLIVDTTHEIRRSALDQFEKISESISFTDCLVMACANFYETKEIFGFDEAFRKNGYKRIGIDK
ncbi:MAG: PIN domain-containing protein [Candidatus Levyibacteriota bacterium]|nr:MAG: PIN domain-containing protein [Candidatus Levybacteria bacterium]